MLIVKLKSCEFSENLKIRVQRLSQQKETNKRKGVLYSGNANQWWKGEAFSKKKNIKY